MEEEKLTREEALRRVSEAMKEGMKRRWYCLTPELDALDEKGELVEKEFQSQGEIDR